VVRMKILFKIILMKKQKVNKDDNRTN